MKRYFRCLRRSCLLMISCIILGTLLILLAYCIPKWAMLPNVKASLETFEKEGIYYRLFDSQGSQLDNFTDTFMVGNTITSKGKGIVDDAMSNYRTSGDGLNNIQSLRAYVEDDSIGFWSYGRYWHGYLVMLKPLFTIFSYSQIRYMNVLFQVGLIVALCVALAKRGLTQLCLPIILAWYLLCPPAVMMSLQFSSVFYIAFGACLLITLFHEHYKKKGYPYIFIIIGAATSYFDLLTYPMLTAVLPLAVILALESGKNRRFFASFIFLAKCGTAWGAGFLGMWFGKWCIASLLTGVDYISQSLNQIATRTSATTSAGEQVAITEGLKRSLETLFTPPVLFGLGLATVLCIVLFVKRQKQIEFSFINVIPFILLSLVPIVWLLITCNHSTVHYWFTYRNLAASAFALFTGILALIRSPSAAPIKPQND